MGRTACTEPQCQYKGELYLTLPLISLPPPRIEWARSLFSQCNNNIRGLNLTNFALSVVYRDDVWCFAAD